MKLLGPILITLAILLSIYIPSKVMAQNSDDFQNEEDAVDDQPSVPIGGSGGTEDRDTQSEGATSFDFNNGDRGCDTNHHNCQHVAKHSNNNGAQLPKSMTETLRKSLPQGCVITSGPTEDLSRLVFQVSCPR